ncbi:DUF3073 domain-containing protein [Gardnerella sp. 2492-Sm]|uniref:DUF3073 domain-containing protein n=1 Tax=unclassified Gardnerella TaxID=2628112 RepID=UPI003D0355D0
MGRGRQKAKQQKIARKLKYLTTDTDYDELAKELNAHEPGQGSYDPFASSEDFDAEGNPTDVNVNQAQDNAAEHEDNSANELDDLDEYAKWAAEAAAKAVSSENAGSNAAHTPAHHHIPMPLPSFMHKKSDK